MAPTQDSLSLANKVAIVTGSGRENGIGAGIALALARAGARVMINFISDSTAPRAAEVVAKIEAVVGKGSVLVIQADAASIEGTKKIVDGTLTGFGVDHIDILVNNAAAGSGGPILGVSQEELTKSFEVNVFGPIYLMQTVTPHMPRGGRIINIGTIASKLGIGGIPLYAASKAAMDTLTHCMAQEASHPVSSLLYLPERKATTKSAIQLGHSKGITINTIAPGPVITDSFDPNGPPQMQQMKEYLVSMTRAENRPGTVEDIADVALFLASEKSRWITGQWISVSGGITGGA